MQKILLKLIIFLIIIILFNLMGCLDFLNIVNKDPVILKANPYIQKIDLNNSKLQNFAHNITRGCEGESRECIINMIYRHIIENYSYIQDPDNTEIIKSPIQTINDGGGDCEDLSILFNSLLENIGIKTYLVMNDTHAYSLVSDINTTKMWGEIERSFINLVEDKWGEKIKQIYNNSFILKYNEVWYYGGNGTNVDEYVEYVNISFDIHSERPIDFYLVPSREDFNNFSENKDFNQYIEFKENNILKTKNQLSYSDRFGGIILYNKNRRHTKIDVNVTFYFHPSFYEYFKDYTILEYIIQGKNCIVVDCTLGEWGYPGYDAGIKGEKIAISSENIDYYYLL